MTHHRPQKPLNSSEKKNLKTVDLEIKQTQDEIMALFCTATKKLATSTLVEMNPPSMTSNHIRILALMCIQKNPSCLNRTGMDRLQFYKKYKEIILVSMELFNGSNNNYAEQTHVDELQLYDKLRVILSNVFHVAWEKNPTSSPLQAHRKTTGRIIRQRSS
jgi:hypothetical protein